MIREIADHRRIALHYTPETCARVPLIALEEIGLPYELHLVDKSAGDHLAPAYRKLNPKGKVPTLVVDGRPLTENPAIQTWLARTYPEARLLPAGDLDVEVDALSTMSWFAAGVHPLITRARLPVRVSDDASSHERIRAIALRQLLEAFAIVEERPADRPWLYGTWSIVDAYLFWLWFRATGSGMDGSSFPRCADHAARIVERPSVARALAREQEETARQRAARASGR